VFTSNGAKRPATFISELDKDRDLFLLFSIIVTSPIFPYRRSLHPANLAHVALCPGKAKTGGFVSSLALRVAAFTAQTWSLGFVRGSRSYRLDRWRKKDGLEKRRFAVNNVLKEGKCDR
ncbi:hypothetical protein TRIATDRAFT_299904, partial [Trichoderma atroviride IMI 206040]